jgi:transcriptional regulator with XRE-family HTH domain
MPDASVDSIVTDPPYGLSFMGKRWDYDVPSEDIWRECLRVLKPGGHLLAFAGTRTQHRMAARIEDAGFEIRDMIAWVYGSGFPKSLDVSKAIDKLGGIATPPEFAAWLKREREAAGLTAKELCERGKFYKNVNHGGLVSNWEAGIGFPNAAQFNLLCDLLGLPFDRRQQVEREILGWRDVVAGVAFTSEGPSQLPITAPATSEAQRWQGWGTALKPALEPITVARKPLIGTVAANVLEHGTGALNVDGCRVATDDPLGGGAYATKPTERDQLWGDDAGNSWRRGGAGEFQQPPGRWPANLIHDGSDEVVGLFPQSGGGHWSYKQAKDGGIYKHGLKDMEDAGTDKTTGSAARFFYCAKASKADRDEGCEGMEERASSSMSGRRACDDVDWKADNDVTGRFVTQRRNHHPTVKPTALMRYLCRLVTPPSGTVLDPFMGSGSTGKAAVLEGFNFIGIEREAEYVQIAKARIAAPEASTELPLFAA